jgi:hypothetical protein
MSQAEADLIGKKIMYSQPPKEPNNVVGEVIKVTPEYIEVKHKRDGINRISKGLSYTITEAALTTVPIVPTIKKIIIEGITYHLENIVSYRLKDFPKEITARIKKIIYDKGIYKFELEHLNGLFIVPIKGHTFKLEQENPSLTDYPLPQLKEIPFTVGQRVSYSLSGMETKAVGEIKLIVIDRNSITFNIMHMKDRKEIIKPMTYQKDGIVVSNFEFTDDELTDEPTKSLDGYKKGDLISFIHIGKKKEGIIKNINLRNKPPLIEVQVPGEPTIIQIPSSQNGLEKVVTGNKKYTLKNENKYYVKYAEYKMKYLSLKK